MNNPILELQNVSLTIPGMISLSNISISLFENEIIAFIGPNGSGKTTVLKVIKGLNSVTSGTLFLNNNYSVSLVPQGRRIIEELTVSENIEIGDLRLNRKSLRERKKMIYDLFPMLNSKKHVLAKYLEGWEQQLLSIARSLMANPHILLLDEPYYGLSPAHEKIVLSKILEIREKLHLSMILSAQSLHATLKQIPRVYIFGKGGILNSPTGEEFFKSQLLDNN